MKQLNNKTRLCQGYGGQAIKIIKYFSFFQYPPTFDEIYTFFSKKTSKKALKTAILKLEQQKKIKRIINCKLKIENCSRYTVGEYTTRPPASKFQIEEYREKYFRSKKKLNNWRFKLYIKLLSFFPQIKLVGLSGSISMMNATENDDVDLFIITTNNRLFTGRLITLVLAETLGLRRRRHLDKRLTDDNVTIEQCNNLNRNKVCLNLFFDESNLAVPKFKQSEYVGHEVLQMKPLISKDKAYVRFLEANGWIYRLFPNSKSKIQRLNIKSNPKLKVQKFRFLILSLICHLNFVIWISNKIESSVKNLQLSLIRRHQTTEIITDTQLWFHPEDFEKKLSIL